MGYYILCLLVDLVLVILAIGFLSCMFCYDYDIEWTGGVWFLSVVIVLAIAGLSFWLLCKFLGRNDHKKLKEDKE